MTLSEFKAWFEGFTEILGDTPPSAEQFSRIKDKVAKIDGTAVTPIVIHEWYRPYISSYYPWYLYSGNTSYAGIQHNEYYNSVNCGGHGEVSNTTQLLYDLGKAEYASMMAGHE